MVRRELLLSSSFPSLDADRKSVKMEGKSGKLNYSVSFGDETRSLLKLASEKTRRNHTFRIESQENVVRAVGLRPIFSNLNRRRSASGPSPQPKLKGGGIF